MRFQNSCTNQTTLCKHLPPLSSLVGSKQNIALVSALEISTGLRPRRCHTRKWVSGYGILRSMKFIAPHCCSIIQTRQRQHGILSSLCQNEGTEEAFVMGVHLLTQKRYSFTCTANTNDLVEPAIEGSNVTSLVPNSIHNRRLELLAFGDQLTNLARQRSLELEETSHCSCLPEAIQGLQLVSSHNRTAHIATIFREFDGALQHLMLAFKPH